jgi:hypothetical protein
MKKLDLNTFPYYYKGVQKAEALANPNPKGLLKMKLAIRIFALSVVLVGVAAASVSSSSSSRTMASHQAATAGNPIPVCAPGLPGCPDLPPTK